MRSFSLTQSSRSPETFATGGSDADTYETRATTNRIPRTAGFRLSIKYSGDKIDAFTNAAGPHHVLSEAGTHLSKAYPVRFSSLKANSFYEYQQGYEENYDGLLLCIHWTMNFHVHMDIAGSVSDLQIRLDTLDIHGCRHATLGDLRIVAKSYRL